jgi:N4-gp56 family major capsid protein
MATLNLHTTANLDNLIPEWWEKKIRDDASKKAIWDKFEGREGSNSAIIMRDDFNRKAGAGDTVHINVVSELYNDGVTGESTLAGSEGKLSIGQFDLVVDWLRNAVAFNKRATKRALFDAVMTANRRLSDWLARTKDEDMHAQLLDNTSTTIYANDATSTATLGTNDVFGAEELDRIKLALSNKGAIPINVIMKGKGTYPTYACMISEVDAYNLKADTTWISAQENAGLRGETNPLFTSAFGQYGGMMVYVHRGLSGFQGSNLRPVARIYGAHTNAITTITVGADATKNYTKFFPSAGTIQVVSVDGTEEYITYTGKTNNTFTGGTRGATYGGSAKDGAKAYVGSEQVTLYNHQARVIGFGAEIAARVWGQQPRRITQTEDYGFEYGIGIECVYGQKAIEDSSGNMPNYLVLETYAANPSHTVT